ncbi:MAG: hypothetical protein WC998_07995 [Candidatus Paceibacterota bacterium]|jgi:hypothetical protein
MNPKNHIPKYYLAQKHFIMKKKKLEQKIINLESTIVTLYRNIDILCGDNQDEKAQIMMDRRIAKELSDYLFFGDGKIKEDE